METKNVSIRGVKKPIWNDFRAHVVKNEIEMGEATTEALKLYLKKKKKHKPRHRFLDLKPVDFGPGNENLSNKIDEILHGEKK